MRKGNSGFNLISFLNEMKSLDFGYSDQIKLKISSASWNRVSMPSMEVVKCDRTGTKVLVKCEGRANQFEVLSKTIGESKINSNMVVQSAVLSVSILLTLSGYLGVMYLKTDTVI